jgi:hypothetical protein
MLSFSTTKQRFCRSDSTLAAFWARSHVGEKRLLAFSRLTVLMEQLGFHWADFHEI